MKTTPLNSFLKFYVMRSPGIDLYGIAHVKVDFIPLQKMYVIPILGRFVWTTSFVQCVTSLNRLYQVQTTNIQGSRVKISVSKFKIIQIYCFTVNLYSQIFVCAGSNLPFILQCEVTSFEVICAQLYKIWS